MTLQNTLTQAPGVKINETDLSNYEIEPRPEPPVCLIFGFSPRGDLLSPKYIRSMADQDETYGRPETSLEKYFYNAASRVLSGGGTPMMVRLPYDNEQCNTVKYVRYSVEPPIHMDYVYADGEKSEERYRRIDNDGVEVLKKMNEVDSYLRGFSRIKCASHTVESMSVQKFEEVSLDSTPLEDDSIYIFDVRKQKLGTNPLLTKSDFQYLGIVPVIVTSSVAAYVQEKIENNAENDKLFNLISIPIEYNDDGTVSRVNPDGLVLDGDWTDMKAEESDEVIQETLKQILTEFSQTLEFNHTGTYYDKRSVGDTAALTHSLIRYNSPHHLESQCFDQLGVVVFEMVFNEDTDKVDFIARESFYGYVVNSDYEHLPIEDIINTKSKYIHIIRKVRPSSYRDFFHISNQPLVVMGMSEIETLKKMHYKKSLEDPISYMLDTWLDDVDGTRIDLILDAGLTTVAHHAWRRYLDDPDSTFYFNPVQEQVFTPGRIDFEELDYCTTAWNKMVKMFTSFIQAKRGDCLFIADGPRCLNLDRNVPLLQRYTNLKSTDVINKYLKYFSDISTSYGTRIFNWVMATDRSTALSIWLPPSIVAAEVYANSERMYFPWYAPAGMGRGRPSQCNFISLRTKPYSNDNNILYSNQWNYFIQGVDTGVVLEGNKTMQKERTALDRVNVRRLCNYIKRQVRDISNRYKYEPNNEGSRGQFAVEVEGLLQDIQRNAGVDAFRIVCDETNNTNETIERNELHCKIAIQPTKAIEYILIDLCLTKDSIQFQEFTS